MREAGFLPGIGVHRGDLLQPSLQHEELRGVALLRLGSLLLVVGSEALHVQPVMLLQLELLLLSFSLQPLQFQREGGGRGLLLQIYQHRSQNG